MRRSLASETAAVLVLLIPIVAVAVFAAQLAPVPSNATDRARAGDVVALVNDAPIRSNDVEAAMNTIVPLTSYHQSLKPEKLTELRGRALDGLIDEELRYQEAVRTNVRVAGAEIEQALARAKKGYRDEQEFEKARRASGATLPEIRASILRALMMQRVSEESVGAKCRVTEADAAAFYRENTPRFLLPEQLRVSLITIGVDRSAGPPEWKRARQKARDLARRIAAGASFDAIAREHSSDESRLKGGDLGFVHRGQLIEEFERALKDVTPGHVTPVVQTIFGFHLLRLAEMRPPAQKSFADVKATIVRDLTETRCKQAADAWTKSLRARARIVIVGGDEAVRRTASAAPGK